MMKTSILGVLLHLVVIKYLNLHTAYETQLFLFITQQQHNHLYNEQNRVLKQYGAKVCRQTTNTNVIITNSQTSSFHSSSNI